MIDDSRKPHPHTLSPEFLIWAFGYETSVLGRDERSAWNSLHGDKLFVEETGGVVEDVTKMYALWLKEKTPLADGPLEGSN